MVSPMIGRNGNGSGLDLHVIRYAEVLLLKAEALYFTGDPAGAADYINMIRERAYGNSDFNYTAADLDRKSTRLNSSHVAISYAVFCLKKKTNISMRTQ